MKRARFSEEQIIGILKAAEAAGNIRSVGRRQWKKESGYHRQARVENTFFRYKSTIGDRLRARHPKSQEAEAIIACNILNRMITLGKPESLAIAV